MVVMTVSGRFGMAMGVLRRGLMGVVTMCSGGVAVIVVTMVAVGRGRGVIVMRDVAVIIMAGRSRGGMVVVSMVGMGRRRMIVMTMVGVGGSMAMVVMAVGRSGRMGGVIVVTMTGVGTVSGGRAVVCALAGIGGVIVVRLVLVAHCDSVPQPLFAVFAAKSV